MTTGRTSRLRSLGDTGALGRGAFGQIAEQGPRLIHPIMLILALAATALLACAVAYAFFDEPAIRYATDSFGRYRGIAGYVTALGLSGYMLVGAAGIAAGAFLLRKRQPDSFLRQGLTALIERAGFVFAAVAVSGLVAQGLKHIVGRARPKLIDTLGAFHFDLFSIKASLASFPSGHATSAFALATALALIVPSWRLPLFAAATAIAVSRFVVGAHYPSDVIAGAALGTIVTLGCAVVFAARSLAFAVTASGIILKDDRMVAPTLRHVLARRRSAS